MKGVDNRRPECIDRGVNEQCSAKGAKVGVRVPSQRELAHKASLAKWAKWDWTKRNFELADETHLSRERISQIRKMVGAPKPKGPRQARHTVAALRWATENLDRLEGLSQAEVGRKYGLNLQWSAGPIVAFLRPLLRDGNRFQKHRWDLMNFQLPSRDLDRVWKLPYNLAAYYRWHKGLPRPRWRYRPQLELLQFKGRRRLPAYRRAVMAEERRAARWFAQVGNAPRL
jgi:hypothetical protein